MSDASNQPEWLQEWRSRGGGAPILPGPSPATTTPAIDTTRQGPDGRFLPGVSGNPKGRKAGHLDTRQKLQNAFADDVVDIAKVVVAKALDGDMGAANIVLSRLLPPLRQQAERVQFEFRTDVPLSQQAEALMLGVSQGLLDPETGRMLVGLLQNVASIRSVEELEQRIIQLEAKTIG